MVRFPFCESQPPIQFSEGPKSPKSTGGMGEGGGTSTLVLILSCVFESSLNFSVFLGFYLALVELKLYNFGEFRILIIFPNWND